MLGCCSGNLGIWSASEPPAGLQVIRPERLSGAAWLPPLPPRGGLRFTELGKWLDGPSTAIPVNCASGSSLPPFKGCQRTSNKMRGLELLETTVAPRGRDPATVLVQGDKSFLWRYLK